MIRYEGILASNYRMKSSGRERNERNRVRRRCGRDERDLGIGTGEGTDGERHGLDKNGSASGQERMRQNGDEIITKWRPKW